MGKNMDWIYRPINEPDLENTLEAVEKALGFKLFVWQKTFIATGVFRQYGATTAKILRELLAVDARPLDYTTRPGSHMGVFYREELLKIKEKLDAAGVPTRKVATSRQQLREYMKEYESKILKDTTPDGLAEKINTEFGNSKAPFLQQVCTQYQTAVVPKMRGKDIVGHEVEYSALVFIEE